MNILEVKKNNNIIKKNIIYDKKVCSYCKNELDKFGICKKCNKNNYISPFKRISMIADKSSFVEFKDDIKYLKDRFKYNEKLDLAKAKTNLKEAIIIGTCNINNKKVVLGIMDSKFMMGTLGVYVGESIVRAFEYATRMELPIILFLASGGARIQEGMFSLVQMAKINLAIRKHFEKRLIYISVITNPTMGGVTASFAFMGDINICEKDSQVGFTGKSIVKSVTNKQSNDYFQTDKYALDNGMIDMILDRSLIREKLIFILDILKNNKNKNLKIYNSRLKKLNIDYINPLNSLKKVRSLESFKGKDYLISLFNSYLELKGDRFNKEDSSVISGIGYIDDFPFAFNIQNKGRNINENIKNNFGLTRPEGYRKVLRICKLAEKFNLPIINIIDSSGADPSDYAESNGQAIAIANCLYEFPSIKTIIISILIGEGASGGSIALSICDCFGMLKNSIYSVISPESYLKILKLEEKVDNNLLDEMRITANKLLEDGIIDEIIDENDNLDYNTKCLKNFIFYNYNLLKNNSKEELINNRYKRIENWDRSVRQ